MMVVHRRTSIRSALARRACGRVAARNQSLWSILATGAMGSGTDTSSSGNLPAISSAGVPCWQFNSLNPYDPNIVSEILKIEDCNYAKDGKQHQLFGLAVSAKRYVVYTRKKKNKLEIIKPSEHGLGIVYVPDKRSRYMPIDCKDQDTTYPRWIVETWERLLSEHSKNERDPANALVSQQLWFDDLPAVMRVRITTPNVLKVLRKRNPEVAKPYNFVLSPILIQPSADCTLTTRVLCR